MNNLKESTYTLTRNKIKIITPPVKDGGVESTREYTYSHYPDLQEIICDFVEVLAQEYSLSAFGHLCTHCGNCCRRDNILVLGGDIFQIAHTLGISDEKFKKRYLKPADTWNENDGYIKLKKKKCPFLKMDPAGYYNCSIYEVRPQSCRMFPAMNSMCEKPAGYLLEFLDKVEIKGEEILLSIEQSLEDQKNPAVITKNYQYKYRLNNEKVQAALDRLTEELNNIEEDDDDELEKAIKKAEKVFDNFLNTIEKETNRKELSEKVADLHSILDDLYKLTLKAPGEYSTLDNLWKKLRLIEAITTKKSSMVSDKMTTEVTDDNEGYLFKTDKVTISSLSIFPDLVTVSIKHENNIIPYPMHFSSDSELRDSIRAFIKAMVQMRGDMLHTVLSDPNPICYLCGECCSYFGVEIAPSDVRRLANGKIMKESEFRDKYLKPNFYSWNRGDACMKKRKFEGEESSKCVLLEKREDGFYYCSIHEIKPAVCRGFSAHHHLCRVINHIKYWERLPKNIIRLDLLPGKLILHTYYTYNNNINKGFIIYWKEEHQLAEKIEKIFEVLRKRG